MEAAEPGSQHPPGGPRPEPRHHLLPARPSQQHPLAVGAVQVEQVALDRPLRRRLERGEELALLLHHPFAVTAHARRGARCIGRRAPRGHDAAAAREQPTASSGPRSPGGDVPGITRAVSRARHSSGNGFPRPGMKAWSCPLLASLASCPRFAIELLTAGRWSRIDETYHVPRQGTTANHYRPARRRDRAGGHPGGLLDPATARGAHHHPAPGPPGAARCRGAGIGAGVYPQGARTHRVAHPGNRGRSRAPRSETHHTRSPNEETPDSASALKLQASWRNSIPRGDSHEPRQHHSGRDNPDNHRNPLIVMPKI